MTTERTGEERGRGIAVRERERQGQLIWPEEMERFFDRVLRSFGMWPRPAYSLRHRRPSLLSSGEWLPEIDVFDQDDAVVVRADLPGMKREDIDVAVEGDMLVIRGQRKEEREVKEENYYCSERATGTFSRAIMLPEGVNPEAIEATYRDGVLEVKVPCPPASQVERRQVQVK